MSPSPTPHDVIFFATTGELRDWFDANHVTAAELWVGYRRKATGTPSVTHWVTNAKQAPTRARRLDALIADSAAGRKVGPMRSGAER